jgi:Glycosyl hydrolase catalytic core
MIWGADAANNPNTMAAVRRAGDTLLTFNEPDMSQQANMTPEQALDLWPKLQATGMRLSSPAPAWGADDSNGWLDQFMTGARQRGYRVDFIALHWYGSDFSPAAVGQLKSYLEATHQRYGLPIWLTEFALINFGGGQKYPTDSQQTAFIRGATGMLQGLPYLQRYAWFGLPATNDSGTGLYTESGTLTAAGRAYRAAG